MGILNWLGFDGSCEEEPVELNDKNFNQEVRKSDIPVIVDIWSDDCMGFRVCAPGADGLFGSVIFCMYSS